MPTAGRAAAVYAEALGVGEKRTAEEQEAPENDLGNELKLGTNSTASELVLTDDFSRRIIDSRVSSGALDPSSKAAERHAEQYYESVRKMTTDAEKIAKNTGFSTKEIESIKSYVFNEEHDLGEDVPMRFFPSYEMAESWQRLIDGKNIQPHDITLIKHELLESKLVRGGMSQDEAHIIASGVYNYSEEVRECYGKTKKRKSRK